MEKEYVTARLFRNRETDCQDSDEECKESEQKPSTEAWSHDSQGNNETVESKSNESPSILSLPERILSVGKKVLERILS